MKVAVLYREYVSDSIKRVYLDIARAHADAELLNAESGNATWQVIECDVIDDVAKVVAIRREET